MVRRKKRRFIRRKIRVPKECYFCAAKTEPDYKEVTALQRFITDRGKLVGKSRNGLCSKHQRRLSEEVKRARYLALLPYIIRPK